MGEWRDDVRTQLQQLHTILDSPNQASDVPQYIIEALLKKIPALVCSDIDAQEVRTMILGAYRALGDVGFMDDDDPVRKQLSKLMLSLPGEK